ncbi:MAG: response regulator [Prochlorothrix sp.]
MSSSPSLPDASGVTTSPGASAADSKLAQVLSPTAAYYIRRLIRQNFDRLQSVVASGAGVDVDPFSDLTAVLRSLYLEEEEALKVAAELDRLAPLHQGLSSRTGGYRKELQELETRIFWLLGLKYKSMAELGSILVVDDTPDNLRLLTSTLTQQGYSVSSAISGKLALKAIKSKVPDLVLLDIRMPEMDGYEVCRQIKSDPTTHHIPILFLSASHETEDKVKAFSLGGADYVTKPFQIEEVLARVQHQLQLYSLQQRLEKQNTELQRSVKSFVKSESTLQQQEQFFRHIYEGFNQAIAVVDVLSNGKFHFVETNLAYERLTGLSQDRLRGRTLAEVLKRDQVQVLQSQYQACVQQRSTLVYEMDFPGPEGVARLCETTLVPITNETGRVVRIIATTMDIGDRKALEQALHQQSQWLQGTIAHLDMLSFVKDLEGRYVALHPQLARLLQKAMADIVGHTDPELFPETAQDLAQTLVQRDQAALAGEVQTGEEQFPVPGGVKTFLAKRKPITNEQGEVIGVLGMLRSPK